VSQVLRKLLHAGLDRSWLAGHAGARATGRSVVEERVVATVRVDLLRWRCGPCRRSDGGRVGGAIEARLAVRAAAYRRAARTWCRRATRRPGRRSARGVVSGRPRRGRLGWPGRGPAAAREGSLGRPTASCPAGRWGWLHRGRGGSCHALGLPGASGKRAPTPLIGPYASDTLAPSPTCSLSARGRRRSRPMLAPGPTTLASRRPPR
jgi:hypothetical protein